MGRSIKPMLPYGHFSYQGRPKSIESLYGRVFEARDVVRFVYGDVRPWAEDLGRKKEYAALAAIFHVRKDDSVPFQLESRREAAEGILAKAGGRPFRILRFIYLEKKRVKRG